MKAAFFKNYEDLSQKASEIIIREIKKKPDLLLCTASGSSPTGTYELLKSEYKSHPKLFEKLRIVKLDEWGGIDMNSPATCETYLQKTLIKPLKIKKANYISFNSAAVNVIEECNRIQKLLHKKGPIDLCLLGLGVNGHIALNEPANALQPHCHVAEISASSLNHPMISRLQQKPSYGLTLGMEDVFRSKKVILIIHGSHKKEMVKKFLSKQITTQLPASLLWLHPKVICLLTENIYPDKNIIK